MKYTTTINKNQSMYRRSYAERNNLVIGFFIGILFTIIIGLFTTTNANAAENVLQRCKETHLNAHNYDVVIAKDGTKLVWYYGYEYRDNKSGEIYTTKKTKHKDGVDRWYTDSLFNITFFEEFHGQNKKVILYKTELNKITGNMYIYKYDRVFDKWIKSTFEFRYEWKC